MHAQDGTPHGVSIQQSPSGQAFATGFEGKNDNLEFSFQARAGVYDLILAYACPSGDKECEIEVNGQKETVYLKAQGLEFTTTEAGTFPLGEV